jgi:hypothetical protein
MLIFLTFARNKRLLTPNGGTLCVFDPHCSYVPTAEPDTPGMQIQDLELLKDSYKDVYDTYLQNELQAAIDKQH